MTKDDKYFMSIALKEAEKARLIDEVPVGCVIVKDNQIISKGHNVRETKKDALGHAEIVAIRKANKKLNSWRLNDCVIYITVEPCLMCTGAIIQSRISKIVYGAPDYKGGAIISSINALEAKNINHHPEVVSGVLEEECTDIIKTYFKNKRANIKENLE
jgi:tRNA(adenine34) deaminase